MKPETEFSKAWNRLQDGLPLTSEADDLARSLAEQEWLDNDPDYHEWSESLNDDDMGPT